ncbi:PadR family transcriptional regulator [Herbiconiux moechotypicola]|uniref:Transcription regulator PadR N-terminal domain-containing protein n=1 Tax=Herbiconiux moechotypicola TaxID=637393 RepID=A0ABN3D6U5_9MICO|nr:PadR family transcriptional regulator [Herbiconiux moechotypicola]MCS5728519.1 PadR family transcriptional regulator [Herbiconiux moechotypicola]
MSVRSGLLLLLTSGDAYGLQLHGALEARTDRVGGINVGQVYSTLERLMGAGLVAAAGSTDDGLPLYALTPAGRDEAERWLDEAEVHTGGAWAEMVFKVLLTASLRGSGAAPVVARYRDAWAATLSAPGSDAPTAGEATAIDAVSAGARELLAGAALDWLSQLASVPGGLAALERPAPLERPRRGRRPTTAGHSAG